MIATIGFDMNDDDDRVSYHQAINGKESLLALIDLREELRSDRKYKNISEAEIIEQKFFRILADRGIDLDRLCP